ncbi:MULTISPECIES: long-chain fatty acid--CoA ligase [Rhodococcus]|uniref:long-chain fatty acid--CoA ligase n=1 Tax=Rhodococcus TaxID=1827 RepID=UPI00193C719F|nr:MULTISPECIES: long-chain fatty acid--CoA ligase [Rhodococcus]QRI77219.1 long-chain fatty acid--CoA ligase [Rhodococcus aetherivorans]QSE60638.1 long-chain fatty acid--CoA ligase [Rhodococcus sp. PSBB066]QSE68054.1 long-chain fatty acid--CoA ligase [Rhodococcus sp. PSBB049]
MLNGLMMDDYQLTIAAVAERAEYFHRNKEVVSRRPDGSIVRSTLGACGARARRLASALAQLGVADGDRVATLMWNQIEHMEMYLAVPAMGAVVHTLNPRLHPDELSFIVGDAQDRVLVVDESLLDVFDSIREGHTFDHVIVVAHDEPAPEGTLDYHDLVDSAAPMSWPSVDEHRAAAMCYTSGTTGRPKGVVYSHRALVLHSLTAALPDTLGVSARDTLLPVVPMFHANAWGLPYAAALIGARLVLPGRQLDPSSVLDLLADERVTITAGVPTVWMGMLAELDADPHRWDLTRLDRLIVGGAAVPRSLLEGFDRHGLTVVQAWGMTETTPLGSICRLPDDLDDGSRDEQYEFRSRQGIAVPFVEIRARREEGDLIDWDDKSMGELEVRGPWVAAAYHNGSGADSFTPDGWFRTGDIVRIDHRGCIRICDRAKDLVKSGGEWISSVDLENHLMAHPAVAEAAVVAVPDARWGERPLAVLALREGKSVDPDALREHLSTEFAKWQMPDRFEILPAIPRTATGKFRKTALREQFS